jgi:outer membrane protein OmpA-like peptidoglycan-associated protein
MIKSGKGLILTAAAATIVVLAASGCATKKYVSKQVNPVNQRLSQYEKETNGKLAWITNKEQTDISQVNERIATTDQRVAEVSTAVQAAQGTASRAMETADANKTQIEASNTAIEVNRTAITNVTNSLNYQLVDKSEVMFAFGKATIAPQAKTALDAIAAKVESMPRAVIEVAGFTDRVGSPSYNLDLSRRRAWAVQRYLVEHKVPARSIHVVGFGEEPAPEGMEAYTQTANRRGKTQPSRMERRVCIRVFGAGDLASTTPTQQ